MAFLTGGLHQHFYDSIWTLTRASTLKSSPCSVPCRHSVTGLKPFGAKSLSTPRLHLKSPASLWHVPPEKSFLVIEEPLERCHVPAWDKGRLLQLVSVFQHLCSENVLYSQMLGRIAKELWSRVFWHSLLVAVKLFAVGAGSKFLRHCFTIVQLQIFKSSYDSVVYMVGNGMHNTLLVMSHPQTLDSHFLCLIAKCSP